VISFWLGNGDHYSSDGDDAGHLLPGLPWMRDFADDPTLIADDPRALAPLACGLALDMWADRFWPSAVVDGTFHQSYVLREPELN
jgi:hypothetical protein